MRRTIASVVLLCILTLAFTISNPAQRPGNPASALTVANARSFLVERGAGNKVKVKLRDGTKAVGTIVRIGSRSFELASDEGRQVSTIEYDDLLELRKAGWSNLATVALGIGIGVAAVVTIVAVAVATVKIDPFPDGFRKKK